MSIGNWLYSLRKFKLIALNHFWLREKNSNILALTYDHSWELPPGWNATYHNINSKFKIINYPDLIIEREFNDGKAIYDALYAGALKKTTPKVFWFIDSHVSSKERI